MKKLLALLPIGLFVAGCTSASKVDAAADAPANTAPVAAEPEPTAATDGYRIVDEASAQYPEDLKAALKKVAVPPPPATFKVPASPKVKFVTTKGDITFSLNEKAAPLHVKSFLYLVSKGFYNNTVFHRWADLSGDGKGYIIQGGDPLSRDIKTSKYAGLGGPGYQIPREYNDLKHDKLVLAAARSNDPNSAGSQFYITQGPVYFLDKGDGYTVFGKVTAGEKAALALRQDDRIKSAEIVK